MIKIDTPEIAETRYAHYERIQQKDAIYLEDKLNLINYQIKKIENIKGLTVIDEKIRKLRIRNAKEAYKRVENQYNNLFKQNEEFNEARINKAPYSVINKCIYSSLTDKNCNPHKELIYVPNFEISK